MMRANTIISLSIAALLMATGSAVAAPFSAVQQDAKPQAQKVDYRRCWIEDGERVCRYVSEAYDDFDDDDYDYGPDPGIVLGFGGIGVGHGHFHGHGGHGHGGHGHGHPH